ncbi:MAG TPA: hypothetical protein DCS93_06660 [Microscillaceae bacterium]|nr:hypothetical protein [Microscillaceae bacterium]
MCLVKIDVSVETRQAFEGEDLEDQVFEAQVTEANGAVESITVSADTETPASENQEEPKVKEVVIDFG